MKKSKAAKAIARVAKERGVSEEDVRRAIQVALDHGRSNPDPKIQNSWQILSQKGIALTSESMIQYLANQVKK